MEVLKKNMSKLLIALAVAALAFCLVGCSGGQSQPEAKAEPANLEGSWETGDGQAYNQTAEISGDTITVKWNSDDGKTTSLYWAGSYVAPTEAGSFEWTSVGDTEQNSKGMMSSTDEEKEFKYNADNDTISYKVSMMQTDSELELHRVE